MNGAPIVAGAVVVTMGLLALSVWVLGRIEARAERRAANRYRGGNEPPGHGDRPRHMRRRKRLVGPKG